MKWIFVYIVAFCGLFLAPAKAEDNPVVLELFTSQGCMACPPADRVIRDIANSRDDLIILSWSVDYWDYMGWEDTFAKPEHTRRQEMYNEKMGIKGVYTPQVVFNGKVQTVGSRRSEVEGIIYDLQMQEVMTPVEITGNWNNLNISIDGDITARDYDILLVWYDQEQTVAVSGGDNSGKRLHYTNVVRGSKVVGAWNGKATKISIDPSFARQTNSDGFAVLLQNGPAGEIVGAAKIILENPVS